MIFGKLKLYALALGGLLLTVLTFGQMKERRGVKKERNKQRVADLEKAVDIERRAGSARMRSDDNLEFRD